jgi:hypothetical protein
MGGIMSTLVKIAAISLVGLGSTSNRKKEEPTTNNDLHDWFNTPLMVRGIMYENRQSIIKNMKVNTPLYLTREPNNDYDKFAIAVYEGTNNQKIGYLPMQWDKNPSHHTNIPVANLMDAGKKIYVGIIVVIKNDHYIVDYLKTELVYQVKIMISSNLEELNNKIQEQKQILKYESLKKSERAKIQNWSPPSKYSVYEDHLDNGESVWDEYDEDGVHYEDYDTNRKYDF